MITKQRLAEKIKKLREDRDMSQEELASRLNVPRPSISQIESSQRDVGSIELAKLSKIFDISIDELLSVEKEQKDVRKSSKMPKFDIKKFKEVLLYILEKCGAKANVGETVLYKLLYFADFDYYELYENYLTGEAYRKIGYGPAPCDFQKTVEEMIKDGQLKKVTTDYHGKAQKRYLPLVRAEIDKWKWTASEKEVIDNVIDKLSNMDATTISDYSHSDIPWEVAQDKEIIDYESVFYRKPSYSVRPYPEE